MFKAAVRRNARSQAGRLDDVCPQKHRIAAKIVVFLAACVAVLVCSGCIDGGVASREFGVGPQANVLDDLGFSAPPVSREDFDAPKQEEESSQDAVEPSDGDDTSLDSASQDAAGLRDIDVSVDAAREYAKTLEKANLTDDERDNVEGCLTMLFGAGIESKFGSGPWYANEEEDICKMYFVVRSMHDMGLIPEYEVRKVGAPALVLGGVSVGECVEFSELSKYTSELVDAQLTQGSINPEDYVVFYDGLVYAPGSDSQSTPEGACFLEEEYVIDGGGILVFFSFVKNEYVYATFDYADWVTSGGTREEFDEELCESYLSNLKAYSGCAVLKPGESGSYKLVSYDFDIPDNAVM